MRRHVIIRGVLVPLLVLAVVVAGGWWASGRATDRRAPLIAAVDALPADTRVTGFTDWAQVRKALDLGNASTPAARAKLTDDAAARDLTTRSIIGRSIESMHASYGWSASDLDWEAYGRSPTSAVMVARLSDSLSPATIRAGLDTLGYARTGRVWRTGPTTAASVGPELASTLAAVALVPDQRLLIAADRPEAVATTLSVVDGDRASLLSSRAAGDLAKTLAGNTSALLQDAPDACAATTLAETPATAQAQAATALDRTGALRSPRYAGRAITDDGSPTQTMRFSFTFGSPGSARGQRDVRQALATGPFIGRTGQIEDSLQLTDTTVDGSTLTLEFDHDADSAVYMTGTGPLLFASCPD